MIFHRFLYSSSLLLLFLAIIVLIKKKRTLAIDIFMRNTYYSSIGYGGGITTVSEGPRKFKVQLRGKALNVMIKSGLYRLMNLYPMEKSC
jgi:hypothetical protein